MTAGHTGVRDRPGRRATSAGSSWWPGLCLLVGAATSLAGALFAIEMLVAILVVRLPEAARAFSVVDAFVALRLELVLALAATAIALLGGGRWSLDALLLGRSRRGSTAANTEE